jgi:hypothetical protein
MASEADVRTLKIAFYVESLSDVERFWVLGEASSLGRKTSFACVRTEIGQAHPQLYGTSYFFVKITPIGQRAKAAHFVGHLPTGHHPDLVLHRSNCGVRYR